MDPEAVGCLGFDGYCMNNTDWKSSIGCSGKCVEKLDEGGDCSKNAVNIHPLDPTHLHESGDGNACKSGECYCGRCANKIDKGEYYTYGVPNNYGSVWVVETTTFSVVRIVFYNVKSTLTFSCLLVDYSLS
jgi:hypothetical protein